MNEQEKLEDGTLEDLPMVSYVHRLAADGPVFVQYKKDPLPPWAYDVKDIPEKNK